MLSLPLKYVEHILTLSNMLVSVLLYTDGAFLFFWYVRNIYIDHYVDKYIHVTYLQHYVDLFRYHEQYILCTLQC